MNNTDKVIEIKKIMSNYWDMEHPEVDDFIRELLDYINSLYQQEVSAEEVIKSAKDYLSTFKDQLVHANIDYLSELINGFIKWKYPISNTSIESEQGKECEIDYYCKECKVLTENQCKCSIGYQRVKASDRLPEKNGDYFVEHIKTGKRKTLRFENDKFYGNKFYSMTTYEYKEYYWLEIISPDQSKSNEPAQIRQIKDWLFDANGGFYRMGKCSCSSWNLCDCGTSSTNQNWRDSLHLMAKRILGYVQFAYQHKPQIPSEEEIDASEYLISGGYFTEGEIKANKPYNPDPSEIISLMNGFAKWALSQTKKH